MPPSHLTCVHRGACAGDRGSDSRGARKTWVLPQHKLASSRRGSWGARGGRAHAPPTATMLDLPSRCGDLAVLPAAHWVRIVGQSLQGLRNSKAKQNSGLMPSQPKTNQLASDLKLTGGTSCTIHYLRQKNYPKLGEKAQSWVCLFNIYGGPGHSNIV